MKTFFLILLMLGSGFAEAAQRCDEFGRLSPHRQPKQVPQMHLNTLPQVTFTEGNLPNVFFTSDQHFGHDKIIEFSERPFASTNEMDEKLIRNWNERVPSDAIIFVVGDFSMNLERAKKILPRLTGTKILIAGNHDLVHPVNRKVRTNQDYLDLQNEYKAAGFDQIELGMKIAIPGVAPFLVTHYPYLDRGERVVNTASGIPYRLEKQELALVCGHVHCEWAQNGRMINVGVDANKFTPVNAIDLRNQLNLLVPTKNK